MGAFVALLQDFWKADPTIDDENSDKNILKANGLKPSKDIKELENLFNYPTRYKKIGGRGKKDTTITKVNEKSSTQHKIEKENVNKDFDDIEIEK